MKTMDMGVSPYFTCTQQLHRRMHSLLSPWMSDPPALVCQLHLPHRSQIMEVPGCADLQGLCGCRGDIEYMYLQVAAWCGSTPAPVDRAVFMAYHSGEGASGLVLYNNNNNNGQPYRVKQTPTFVSAGRGAFPGWSATYRINSSRRPVTQEVGINCGGLKSHSNHVSPVGSTCGWEVCYV
jgi:hypothetical protein